MKKQLCNRLLITTKAKKLSITWIVSIFLSLITVYPFLLILVVSLKSNDEFFSNPIGIPRLFEFRNYYIAYVKANIPRAFISSFIITSFSIIVMILCGSLAAYALSKMNFSKASFFAAIFLMPMIFPIHTVIVPLYLLFKFLHLTNTFLGMIIIHAAIRLPFAIFVLTGFMKTIPNAISESAVIDGASHITIFALLILPLVKPAIATVTILNGLLIWNDFFLSLIMISKSTIAPLPLKIYTFSGEYEQNWPMICTCIVFLAVPIIIGYSVLQKQIISGIVAGSIKG
ncbi:MAG: carbohydrate ABC transporter permease [Spirochaetaceae bacterium]|nr:MAG: carbohydrate ABC transporter permease [Spirochaetaceae bacterium]